MRRVSVLFILSVVFSVICAGPSVLSGATVDEAVKAADSGDLAAAIAILNEITAADEADSDAWAYLGLYTGMSAGQAKDYMEAGRLTMKSFEFLDRSIAIEGNNAKAYLFRGIMGVQVPDFLGRLDGGIKDLKKAAGMFMPGGEADDPGSYITALSMLANGYDKKGDIAGRRSVLETIINAAPGSEAAAKAQEELKTLPEIEPKKTQGDGLLAPSSDDSGDIAALREKVSSRPDDPGLLLDFATALYSGGKYEEAADALKRYIELEDGNAEAFIMLSTSLSMLAAPGYDQHIYEDTNYRSRLAMEAMLFLDRAVALEPDDMALRLRRGINGITFPYFLGKFQQGVEDLEMVRSSEASAEMRAEATYYLGLSKQREAMRYWLEVAKEFKGTEAEAMVYGSMRPKVARLDPDRMKKPFVMIDFILGFEDELPPQTAIWVESEKGEYVATLYVSGFAGYVKENQVTLPAWARDSGFEGIDAVTGPSIEIGHHIYTWDLADHTGARVKNGIYRIKVEVSHWPTLKYQIVESEIRIGKDDDSNIVEEGDFIPRLEVGYFYK